MLRDYFNRKNKILLVAFLVYNIILLSFMHISFNKSKKDYIEEHNIISYKFFKVNEKTEDVENVLPYQMEGFVNKYKPFLSDDMAMYISYLSKSFNIDPDIMVAILKTENLTKNPEAVSKPNKNGSVDIGLFQLNDRSLYSKGGFVELFWKFDELEFQATNWKHNTYIAVRYVDDLCKSFGRDILVAPIIASGYNGGRSTAIKYRDTGVVPAHVQDYVTKFTENLKEIKYWSQM